MTQILCDLKNQWVFYSQEMSNFKDSNFRINQLMKCLSFFKIVQFNVMLDN